MQEEKKQFESPQINVIDILQTMGRILTLGAGVVVVVLGVIFSIKLFYLVYGSITVTQEFQTAFKALATLVGEREFDVEINGKKYPVANILAFLFFVLLCIIASTIITQMMQSGAQMIALSYKSEGNSADVDQRNKGSRKP
ncbi:hypothetical protein HYY75_04875 [bacterium]|nr:hypothetical protein [bacterium]